MTQVTINGRLFDIDMIVFDKDGTLFDLHFLWSQQIEKWGNLLQDQLKLNPALISNLYSAMGYDQSAKRLLPDSPSAVATMAQFMTISAFFLYQHGIPWTIAEEAVHTCAAGSVAASPDVSMLKYIGDVEGTFKRLEQAGIRIAIMTSDSRRPTESTLALLNLARFVESVVCGDDPIANKPEPDGLFYIAEKTAVSVSRMLMIGDSVGDIRAGRSAGVAGCIGIGDQEALTAVSDVMISSIDEIMIL